jgi:multicomponent Na+:H+ antiporter subunit E
VLLFAAVWLVLTDAAPGSWLIGAPAVAAAAWASVRLTPCGPKGVSLAGLARFTVLFVRESVRGGLDVAARTLGPRLRVHPGFSTFDLSLPEGRPRLLMAACVSLLPGTLTAELSGNRLRVHLLDDRVDPREELARLEAAIAALFDDGGQGD